MPGKFTDKGFYEAQWGYLLDANPDFVSNVSDLYDITVIQLGKNTTACLRKSFGLILKRDCNGNHLVEMMTDNILKKEAATGLISSGHLMKMLL